MAYVFSTLANNNCYNLYDVQGSNAQTPVVIKSVLVNGGTGVAQKNLITPLGVATFVSDEDLELLKKNEVFMGHLDGGYITIRDSKVDPEVAAADMKTRDISAPIVPEDFKESDDIEKAKPTLDKKAGNIRNTLK